MPRVMGCLGNCGDGEGLLGKGVSLRRRGHINLEYLPKWVMVSGALFFGLWWMLGLIYHWVSRDEQPVEGAESIYLLYVDRELRVLDLAEGAEGWPRWLYGYEEGEETVDEALESLRKTLEEGARRELLGAEGHQGRVILALRAGDKEAARLAYGPECLNGTAVADVLEQLMGKGVPEKEAVDELAAVVWSGSVYAWEPWLLRHADGLTGGHLAREGIYQTYNLQNERMAERVLPWNLAMVVLTLMGIGLIPLMTWKFCREPVRREARVLSIWGVSVVFTAFFGAGVAADQGYQYLWLILTGLPFNLNDWQWNLVLLFADAVWRIFPVVLISVTLFSNPMQLWRSFRLGGAPALLLVAGTVGGLWLWHWVSYTLMGDEVLVDPTDFLNAATTDWSTMLYVVVSGCILAPVTEEIMYRGLLFLGLRRHTGPWVAMAVSTVLFAMSHWQYDLAGMISVGVMGLASAVLVWRTGSLLPSIILHVAFNLLITFGSYISYQWPV
ncbi:MAG: type II CAAX endopeptidase family protein [Akkermansiaceae bacterium]|nr:type II CAAX endopeptidase family protein [Akkermansiaceae bacterium]